MHVQTANQSPPLDIGLINHTLATTFYSLPLPPDRSLEQKKAQQRSAALVFSDLDPRTPVEATRAARAVASHYGSMECFRLAHAPDTPVDVAIRWISKGVTLTRVTRQALRDLEQHQAAGPVARVGTWSMEPVESAAPPTVAVAAPPAQASATPAGANGGKDPMSLEKPLGQAAASSVAGRAGSPATNAIAATRPGAPPSAPVSGAIALAARTGPTALSGTPVRSGNSAAPVRPGMPPTAPARANGGQTCHQAPDPSDDPRFGAKPPVPAVLLAAGQADAPLPFLTPAPTHQSNRAALLASTRVTAIMFPWMLTG